jgi:indole-3-glycerol phosphate synthase
MHKVLSQILEAKRTRIEVLKKNQDTFASLAKKAKPVKDFKQAITREGKISFIGEIKKASPSSGILREDFSVTEIAKIYHKCKVNAISVITEEDYFLGKLSYIAEVKKVTSIPVLRKDFIIDEVQVAESRAAGADAILLIMAALTPDKFTSLYNYSRELGMRALVEVHTEKELRRALSAGAEIVGVNNRNLSTFEIDVSITHRMIPFIPENVTKVSESGLETLKDILLLKGMGVDAVLIGSSLMQAKDIEAKVKELHIDA